MRKIILWDFLVPNVDSGLFGKEDYSCRAVACRCENLCGTDVKKDSEFFSTKYEVRLDDGTEIEFNKDGEPVDIDMED